MRRRAFCFCMVKPVASSCEYCVYRKNLIRVDWVRLLGLLVPRQLIDKRMTTRRSERGRISTANNHYHLRSVTEAKWRTNVSGEPMVDRGVLLQTKGI